MGRCSKFRRSIVRIVAHNSSEYNFDVDDDDDDGDEGGDEGLGVVEVGDDGGDVEASRSPTRFKTSSNN